MVDYEQVTDYSKADGDTLFFHSDCRVQEEVLQELAADILHEIYSYAQKEKIDLGKSSTTAALCRQVAYIQNTIYDTANHDQDKLKLIKGHLLYTRNMFQSLNKAAS